MELSQLMDFFASAEIDLLRQLRIFHLVNREGTSLSFKTLILTAAKIKKFLLPYERFSPCQNMMVGREGIQEEQQTLISLTSLSYQFIFG